MKYFVHARVPAMHCKLRFDGHSLSLQFGERERSLFAISLITSHDKIN